MGMANSDNEEQIYRDHAMRQKMRECPRNPNTYDHRAGEMENAYYEHDVKRWAAEVDELNRQAEEAYWSRDTR